MSAMKVTIHSTGPGTCSLSGKEGVDGLTVTFEDGTVKESHLSWRSFKQLLALKVAQGISKPETKPVIANPGSAPAIVTPK